ncbi:MAG: hypothetical protein H0W58_08405 [Acidobacteria bacterium]|nr:hypothetical protein [Acidobacteriota bacterium]
MENYTYGATNARLIKRDGTTNDLTYYAWAGAEVIAEYTEIASQPNIVKWSKSYIQCTLCADSVVFSECLCHSF